MTAHTDNTLRRAVRYPTSEKIRLSWQDENGSPQFGYGRVVDLSETGFAVLVDAKIPVRTFVQFEFRKLRLRGAGSVRFCRSKGLQQKVGLEFGGSVRWDPSKDPLPESPDQATKNPGSTGGD